MSAFDSVRVQLADAARKRDDAVRLVHSSVLRATHVGLSQREIARALGVSQPAISQMVAATRLKSQLARGPVGKRLAEHRAEVIDIAKAHRASRIRVFGSVAAGRDTEASDLDLLVTMPKSSGMLAVAELGEELAELLGVAVDIVPEHMVKPAALAGLRRAAVAL